MSDLPMNLAAIKARAEKATPGPWHHDTAKNDEDDLASPDLVVGPPPNYDTLAMFRANGGQEYRDANFAAHAREDIPRLLDRVARWEAVADELYSAPGSIAFTRGMRAYEALKAEMHP
jgi:hypothetical protein